MKTDSSLTIASYKKWLCSVKAGNFYFLEFWLQILLYLEAVANEGRVTRVAGCHLGKADARARTHTHAHGTVSCAPTAQNSHAMPLMRRCFFLAYSWLEKRKCISLKL